MTAQVAVSGKVGGHRMRARLTVGLAEPAAAYIEAPAPFGAPIFVFAAVDNDATLLLPRDRRVLEHGRPAAVLEAIAGVPLSPDGLRMVLTGCAADGDARRRATAPDSRWRVFPGSDELYVHRDREADPWRLVVVMHRRPAPEWRAEYRDFVGNLPRSIHLVSAEAGRFDLQLMLSDVEMNVPIDADTFRVPIPADSTPLTIEELRDAGPLDDTTKKSEPRR
jgi:hypothetical protein